MALINCPECGREISDKALSCPHCRYPIQTSASETTSESQIVEPEKQENIASSSTSSSEPKRKKSGTAIAIGVVAVLALAIVLTVTAKKCYVCGSIIGVRPVTLVGETYYLCNEHYKSIMTPSSRATTSSYSSSSSSTTGTTGEQNALKSAKNYLSTSLGFSRSSLIDQLEYEGFTHEQAVYGVEQNGY